MAVVHPEREQDLPFLPFCFSDHHRPGVNPLLGKVIQIGDPLPSVGWPFLLLFGRGQAAQHGADPGRVVCHLGVDTQQDRVDLAARKGHLADGLSEIFGGEADRSLAALSRVKGGTAIVVDQDPSLAG